MTSTHSQQTIEIDDAAVESVMLDLLGEPVEIIQRFNRPLRDRYMDNLRDHVRQALVKAFDPDARAQTGKRPCLQMVPHTGGPSGGALCALPHGHDGSHSTASSRAQSSPALDDHGTLAEDQEPDGDAGCTCHPPRSAPGIWVAHQPGCPERDRLRALGLDESHEATETTKPLGAFSCCNCQQGWHMTWAGIVNCRRLAATTKTGEQKP